MTLGTCPYCHVAGTYRNNLRTHLMGSTGRGGHEVSRDEADAIIDRIEAGGSPTPRAAQPQAAPVVRRRGQPIRTGHDHALDQLEKSEAYRATRDLYAERIPRGVYLRPTDAGLVVISLDFERCASMVGVGSRQSKEYILPWLPPSRPEVSIAVAGYEQKIATLDRRSVEERFALQILHRALSGNLSLPLPDTYFVCQEWRLPDTGKVDILGISPSRRRLVVIELKESEQAASLTKGGGDAWEQAQRYCKTLHEHRGSLYPFFERLARAMAANHEAPPELREVRLDPNQTPEQFVWWPGCAAGVPR